MNKLLSLIIARKGSKGLPNKCLLKIKDIPVIEYTTKWITSLFINNVEHDIAISTDITELKIMAGSYNIRFIKRPFELAQDNTTVEEVIFHAINFIKSDHDFIALWMGNIPIRYYDLLIEPLDFLQQHPEFTSVISFQNVEKFNPNWMFPLAHDQLPEREFVSSRRQDLPQFMIHDGHTLIVRKEVFLENYHRIEKQGKKKIYEHFGPKIKPWLHDKLVIDIDTEKDYFLAKNILK